MRRSAQVLEFVLQPQFLSLQFHDPKIVAIAADVALPQAQVPVLAIDDVEGIIEVILARAEPVSGFAGRTEES